MKLPAPWMMELYLRVDPNHKVEEVARVIYETNDYLKAGRWDRMFPEQKEPFYRQARAVLKVKGLP